MNAVTHSTMNQEEIYRFIKQYTRPVTILELNANIHSPIFQLATKVHGTCVMTCHDNDAQQLLQACTTNKLENVILLNENLSLNQITMLGKCEHFDIVIAHAQEYASSAEMYNWIIYPTKQMAIKALQKFNGFKHRDFHMGNLLSKAQILLQLMAMIYEWMAIILKPLILFWLMLKLKRSESSLRNQLSEC